MTDYLIIAALAVWLGFEIYGWMMLREIKRELEKMNQK